MKAIIFDLDGTLLNTLEDLADSMNHVLSSHNYPPYPLEQYKHFVGEGMNNLVKKAVIPFTNDNKLLESMYHEMKDVYGKCWNKKTKVYTTINEVLTILNQNKFLLSVLSNKPDSFTKMTIQYFFPQIIFFTIQGALDSVPRKPNPTGALSIINKTNLPKKEWMMIGDSSVDMETAKNANIYPAGVSWGFREKQELLDSGAKIIFDQPPEILNFLNQSNEIGYNLFI